MGTSISIATQPRTVFGKNVKKLRLQGIMPGVVYGNASTNEHVELNTKEFTKVYREAGSNTIIDLSVDGKNIKTIIYHVDFDPVTDEPRHVDFYKVRMNEELTTTVPLNFIGESAAVRMFSAIIVHGKEEVTITCLPGDLPHQIDVDISVLANVDDMIYIKDLPVPPKVKIDEDPETLVAQAIIPREIKAEEPAATEVEGAPAAEGAPAEGAEAAATDKKED
ncbi:50S ribosomal protein L25 [Candidatus Gracilibacteria bacterium]|nr:50S ribosomal protein L25 [Candidatus Gracilibacteria bacterium]